MLIFLFASNSDENEWCASTGRENTTKRKAANKTPCIYFMDDSLRFASAYLVGPLFNSHNNNVTRTVDLVSTREKNRTYGYCLRIRRYPCSSNKRSSLPSGVHR